MNKASSRTERRVRFLILYAWGVVLFERLLRSFWPLGTLLITATSAIFLGLAEKLERGPILLVAASLLIIAVILFAKGAAQFQSPRRSDAVQSLDAGSRFAPLTAIEDRPAMGASGAAGQALWALHQKKMQALARDLRAPGLNPGLPRRDPYAIRLFALWLGALALLFGASERVTTVAEIVNRGSSATAATGPLWEGWIEPPAYTGKPNLYLADIPEGTFAIPVGSKLSVRFYDDTGDLTLEHTFLGTGPSISAEAIQEFEINQGGRMTINGPNGRSWQLAVIPDAPPQISWIGFPEQGLSGDFTQRYMATDDYGVTSGEVEIRLNLEGVERRYGLAPEPDDLAPLNLELPLPISGRLENFQGDFKENLEKHPWANLPVVLSATVTDARGQTGAPDNRVITLPARRFFDPLAKSIIELRRDLLWSKENMSRVSQVLRAISNRPEGLFDESIFLQLRVAVRRLVEATEDEAPQLREEVAEALWQMALKIENGNLADARDRLARAQERLKQAMEDGATNEELAELMRELREAMDDLLRQLAEQGGNTDQQFSENSNVQELTQDQLNDLLNRMQELIEQGRMAEAEQLLEQLRRMMENLQMAENPNSQGAPSPGQQAMEGLSDMLRDQQGLNDDTFDGIQNQFGSNEQGTGPGRPTPDGSEQGRGPGQDLADRQGALRQEMEKLLESLPGAGTELGDRARESLERADRAMEGAERALRDDAFSEALDDQSRALEAMRQGARDLAEQLAQDQQGSGSQGEAFGRAEGAEQRDPFGRQTGSEGRRGSDEEILGEDAPFKRAEELIEELRRRSSDPSRPEIELDYLKRLLERF